MPPLHHTHCSPPPPSLCPVMLPKPWPPRSPCLGTAWTLHLGTTQTLCLHTSPNVLGPTMRLRPPHRHLLTHLCWQSGKQCIEHVFTCAHPHFLTWLDLCVSDMHLFIAPHGCALVLALSSSICLAVIQATPLLCNCPSAGQPTIYAPTCPCMHSML